VGPPSDKRLKLAGDDRFSRQTLVTRSPAMWKAQYKMTTDVLAAFVAYARTTP